MTAADNEALAERHIKFRIFASTMLAFGLLANYSTTYGLIPATFFEYTHLLAGGLFAMLILLLLANGQEHLWSNKEGVRRLLGDESTVENRRRAQAFGFWATIVAAILVYAAAFRFAMPGPEAARLVACLALAAAALRFAILEQRALNP